jgi:hypothetical protein
MDCHADRRSHLLLEEKVEMARFLYISILLAVILGACAPAAPTVDPAQVQASAVAAASTMIAQTVQAIPTSTPIPPTQVSSPTPLPPPTLAPLPTLANQPAPTTASTVSNCNQLLDVGAAGPTANIMIKNDAKAPITFNMGFSTKNTFGQCGYRGWAIGKGSSISVSMPQVRTNLGDSCYWVYVWINDPKAPKTLSPSAVYCIDNGLKWTFDVTPTNVKLAPP